MLTIETGHDDAKVTVALTYYRKHDAEAAAEAAKAFLRKLREPATTADKLRALADELDAG